MTLLDNYRLIALLAQLTCAAKCKPFLTPPKNIIDLTSDEEGKKDDEGKPLAPSHKKVKVAHPEPRVEELWSVGVLVLKQLKSEIMTLQGQIKSAEAELGLIGVRMGKLVRRFDDIETVLGM